MKATLLLILLLIAGGCSAYHPLRNGVGFAEVPLGQEAYQITFAAVPT